MAAQYILWQFQQTGNRCKTIFNTSAPSSVKSASISYGGKYVSYILDRKIILYALDINKIQQDKIAKQQQYNQIKRQKGHMQISKR